MISFYDREIDLFCSSLPAVFACIASHVTSSFEYCNILDMNWSSADYELSIIY